MCLAKAIGWGGLLQVDKPIIVHCDKQSALMLATNTVCHAITKWNWEWASFHWWKGARWCYSSIGSERQSYVMNIFTKSRSKGIFGEFQAKLELVSRNSL